MKATIYYFSSTGNSLDVANLISKEIGSALHPMVGCENHICESDVVGFVYSTYFWGLPHIVEEFVRKLELKAKNPYIFAITLAKTSGGGLGSMNQLLKEKGFRLNYGKTVHSISNYIIEYDIDLNTVEKVIKNAREQAITYSKDILLKKENNCKKIPFLTNTFHNIYLKRSMDSDRNFQISNTCVGCGICKEVCPTKNIKLVNGQPEFQHRCEHCIACIHWCPKQAIQYKSKTQKHNRYHNPNIKRHELNK